MSAAAAVTFFTGTCKPTLATSTMSGTAIVDIIAAIIARSPCGGNRELLDVHGEVSGRADALREENRQPGTLRTRASGHCLDAADVRGPGAGLELLLGRRAIEIGEGILDVADIGALSRLERLVHIAGLGL